MPKQNNISFVFLGLIQSFLLGASADVTFRSVSKPVSLLRARMPEDFCFSSADPVNFVFCVFWASLCPEDDFA